MSTCRHCHHDEARRNLLCNTCSLYERRTGRLPSQRTLYRRAQARQQRQREGVEFVVALGPELTRELARLYAAGRQVVA